jgi:hypothetical protein
MRSYNIQGEIDLKVLEKYLLGVSYPIKILLSTENILKFKLFGFYRLTPLNPILFDEAIVTIKYIKNSDLTNIKFSIFTTYYLALFCFPLIGSIVAAGGCKPANFFEFTIFFFIFYPIFFLPGLFWAWFKQKRLISILSKHT